MVLSFFFGFLSVLSFFFLVLGFTCKYLSALEVTLYGYSLSLASSIRAVDKAVEGWNKFCCAPLQVAEGCR